METDKTRLGEVFFKDLPEGFLKRFKAWAAVHDTLYLLLYEDTYETMAGDGRERLMETVWWDETSALSHLLDMGMKPAAQASQPQFKPQVYENPAREWTKFYLKTIKVRVDEAAKKIVSELQEDRAENYSLRPIMEHLINEKILRDLEAELGSVLNWTKGWMLAAWHAAASNPDLDRELKIPKAPILEEVPGIFKKHGLFLVSFFQEQLLRASGYFSTLKTQRHNAAQGWGKLEDLLKRHLKEDDLLVPVRYFPYLERFIQENEGVVVYRDGAKAMTVKDCLQKHMDDLSRRPEAQVLLKRGGDGER